MGFYRPGLMTEVWIALLLYGSGVIDDLPLLERRGVRRIFGWARVPDPTTFGRWLRVLVQENAALERENATLREPIAELERSAAPDSTTSSKPPASDSPGKKSATPRRTRSPRGPSPRPSGGQPGHKGTTLARTDFRDHVVDHDPSDSSGCSAPLSDADRHGACDLAILRAVIATARKQGWNILDTFANPGPIQRIPKLHLRKDRYRNHTRPPQSLTSERPGQSDLISYVVPRNTGN